MVAPEADSSYVSVLDPEGVVRLLYVHSKQGNICMPYGRASVLANGLTSAFIGGTARRKTSPL
jgi:hypothetical protein